jgi:hypothetical protein
MPNFAELLGDPTTSSFVREEIHRTKEEWVAENCDCGLDELGVWRHRVFELFGCTCKEDVALSMHLEDFLNAN